MSVDFLSIFIIVISALGVFGLALIFLHRKSHLQDQTPVIKNSQTKDSEPDSYEEKHVRNSANRMRIEPTVSNEIFSDNTITSLGFSTMDVLQTSEPAPIISTSSNMVASVINKELILFYLLAAEQHPFSGYELLQSLLAAGLHYGKMNVFHRHENTDGTGEVLFSLTSAVEPGIFDLANIGGFTCPGLSLFMLPGKAKDSAATFELMLETAQQLADDLGGNLFDDERKPLTEHGITQIRTLLQPVSQ